MSEFRENIVSSSISLGDAIGVLDKVSIKILLVTSDTGKLVGTVTDGDIRRALVRRNTMDVAVTEIMFTEPVTASYKDSKSEYLKKMKDLGVLQIPILNNDKVIGLETISHLEKNKCTDTPVFLMAGGFGKRLMPLTERVPKPLLEVGNKPILETILEQLIQFGFENFFISTHYKADLLKLHFGDGKDWGVKIQYIHEDEPLGTAGALGLLPKDLPGRQILMMNGDLLTKVDFGQLLNMHMESDEVVTMCVREYEFQVPFGVVDVDDHYITRIIEKPVHQFFINAGIYVLDTSIVNSVEKDCYLDMPSLIELQIETGKHVGLFPIHEYWIDIGQIDQYKQAELDYSND